MTDDELKALQKKLEEFHSECPWESGPLPAEALDVLKREAPEVFKALYGEEPPGPKTCPS